MSYLYSQLDKDNSRWFENHRACNSLKSISVTNGSNRDHRLPSVSCCVVLDLHCEYLPFIW